jgi:hypothetical protein
VLNNSKPVVVVGFRQLITISNFVGRRLACLLADPFLRAKARGVNAIVEDQRLRTY